MLKKDYVIVGSLVIKIQNDGGPPGTVLVLNFTFYSYNFIFYIAYIFCYTFYLNKLYYFLFY